MRVSIRLLHWLPRTLCILAILFVSLFALDAFAPGPTIRQQLGAFLMHLLPSFILLAFLVVAWKWELVGGILLAATGVGLSPFVFALNYRRNHSIGVSLGIILAITIPFALVGVLFILCHRMKKSVRL
jgi:hypothetical protein